MPFATAGSVVMLDSVTVHGDDDIDYSKWVNVQPGFSFTVWVTLVSSSATPHVTFYLDISPLTETIAQTTVDLTKYVRVTLASDVTTESTMIRYANTALDTPFCQCRLVAAGVTSNADDTVVRAWLTQFN